VPLDPRRRECAQPFDQGYELLDRNLRFGHLEIDLVARKGPLAVVVEVRTRGAGAYDSAFGSVRWTKRGRLLHAADRLWRFRLSRLPGIERMRIDVAAVVFEPEGAPIVRYAKGAITR
jgi:putative endonuclease